MGDEEPQCKVEYLDLAEGADPEETNWIRRAGKARVTYVNGCIFEGTFDEEKIKQGQGTYIWMAAGADEDAEKKEVARFEGNYVGGVKDGVGKMTFPTGDVYEGQWTADKFHGEGSYTYKKTGDIYSGSWSEGKKHGQGTYEFGADSSMMSGTWDNGTIVNGSWILQGAGQFDGNFKLGRPFGAGKFTFASGLSQAGS
jgi:radial spoke head protein 1